MAKTTDEKIFFTNPTSLAAEAKEIWDNIHALMKMTRWTYELAVNEGFSSEQALDISKSYIQTMLMLGKK